jgi:hypothetical protein
VINGDFVRTCSGLFLHNLKNGYAQDGGIYGNVFNGAQLEHLYNPDTGALAQVPLGKYTLSRVLDCR